MKWRDFSLKQIVAIGFVVAVTIGSGQAMDWFLKRSSWALNRSVEAELARNPLFAVAAENDPEDFARQKAAIVALLAKSGGKLDPNDELKMQAIGREISAGILPIAARGGDEAVYGWLEKEDALIRRLASEDVRQCAKRSLGVPFNTTEMSPQSQAANLDVMKAITVAYRQGKSDPVAIPEAGVGQSLLIAATRGPVSSFSADEIAVLAKLPSQRPEIVCTLTLKLLANVLALPRGQAAAVERFLQLSQAQATSS